MKQPDEGREWVRRWTASVAETMKQSRGRMSAQQLSDRCAELGYPIPRSTITNLEIGRKESISIQEVAILARALKISPLALVFPLGRGRTFDVLPDETISTWLAAEWFTGEGSFPVALENGGWGGNTEDYRAWKADPSQRFRELRKLQEQWNSARRWSREARLSETTEDVEFTAEKLRVAEDQLRRHRQQMRALDLDPDEPPIGFSDSEDGSE